MCIVYALECIKFCPEIHNHVGILNFRLLLSTVSVEDTQDRTDRVLLTPWVKFLWEAYRNVLDLLRNNNKVERLYQDTAQQGIVLCF